MVDASRTVQIRIEMTVCSSQLSRDLRTVVETGGVYRLWSLRRPPCSSSIVFMGLDFVRDELGWRQGQ